MRVQIKPISRRLLGLLVVLVTLSAGLVFAPTPQSASATTDYSVVPVIEGELHVGSVLLANTGTWSEHSTLTYQWYRNGVPISGAQARSYELTDADYGTSLRTVVRGASPAPTSVTMRQSLPTAFIEADSNNPVTAQTFSARVVSAGVFSTCALQFGGMVQCAGRDQAAQAGGQLADDSAVPLIIPGVKNAATLSVGRTASCVTTVTGELNCWGFEHTWGSGIPQAGVTTLTLPSPAVSVSVSQRHGCAVLVTGQVACWGSNFLGALGTGDEVDHLSPVVVPGLEGVVAVGVGIHGTCALDSGGTVWCWGRTSYQVGNVDYFHSLTPRSITGVTDGSQLIIGPETSCVITKLDVLKCWGANTNSQLSSTPPYEVVEPVTVASSVSSAAVGLSSLCYIAKVTLVTQCRGSAEYAQLGNGTSSSANFSISVPVVNGAEALAVTGNGHVFCLTRLDTTVRCWGDNWFRQIARVSPGNNDSELLLPVVAEFGKKFISTSGPIIVGDPKVGTEVFVWVDPWAPTATFSYQWCRDGVPISGAIGERYTPRDYDAGSHLSVVVTGGSAGYVSETRTSTTQPIVTGGQFSPSPAPYISGTFQVGSRLTASHASWDSRAGLAYQWSRDGVDIPNAHGLTYDLTLEDYGASIGFRIQAWRDGFDPVVRHAIPSPPIAPGTDASTVPAGANFAAGVSVAAGTTCAITLSRQVQCIGRNNWGQLGNGSNVNSSSAVFVSGIDDAVAVSVADNFACALHQYGAVSCWGDNGIGQLGTGDTEDSTTPRRVVGQSTFVSISVAGSHACAIATDGSAWCWGSNTWGELGNANVDVASFSSTPVLVQGLYGVISLDAGSRHSCAIIVGNYVKCWGRNNFGQLGDGTTINKNVPVSIARTFPVISLSAGDSNTCALALNGSIFCWGLDLDDTLGTHQENVSTPTALGQLDGAIRVSVGNYHSCVQDNAHAVWCWGSNSQGQLTSALPYGATIATRIDLGQPVIDVIAGAFGTCVIFSDRSTKCWGYNEYNSVASGSTANVTTPVFAGFGLTQLSIPSMVANGSTAVGDTLAANITSFVPGTRISYEWRRDGSSEVVDTSPAHLITGADFNHRLTLTGVYSRPGYIRVTQSGSPSQLVTSSTFVSAPEPTLSGNATVGSTLQLNMGTWDEGTEFTYQWYSDNGPISGANGSSLELTSEQAGTIVEARISATRIGAEPVQRSVATSTIVTGGVLAVTGNPNLNGQARVGQILTMNPGTWTPGAAITYQWKRVGQTAVIATTPTYKATLADFGKQLTVTISVVKAGFNPEQRVATSAVVVRDPFLSAPVPLISGVLKVGQKVTATVGSWLPVPTSVTYQWMREGTVISGARAATYQLTPADLGRRISVVVVAGRAGFDSTTRASAETSNVSPAIYSKSPAPTVRGQAIVGQRLTGVLPAWTPATPFTYRWLADGVAIQNATQPSLLLSADLIGKRIRFEVTSTRSGYEATTVVSAPSALVDLPAIVKQSTPAIASVPAKTARVGSVLTVLVGTWTPGTTFTYQWMRGATPIDLATSVSYELSVADLGSKVSVQVTAAKAGFKSVLKSSAPTTAVTYGVFSAAPVPVIAGRVATGQHVTVVEGLTRPSSDYFSYVWNRAGKPIPGATADSYDVVAADRGKALTVTVTSYRTGYVPVSKTSAPLVARD